LRADVLARGYRLDTTTRAMAMRLDELDVPRPEVDAEPADLAAHARAGELPAGLLDNVDDRAFHVLVARLGGEAVATGIAFDRDGDCGIYNVGTLEHARRRGLGTAVTARLLYDAAARGCTTASLQSTAMAERVYASVGFRDLGRILEFVPAQASSVRSSQTRSRSSMPSISRPGSYPVAGVNASRSTARSRKPRRW
jgi:GNAT superfamily N-acetyltransferase